MNIFSIHIFNLKKLYYSKRSLALIFTAIFAAGFAFLILSIPSQVLAVDSNYVVLFNSRTLDHQNNTSTWSYTVYEIHGDPELSHWIWQPCFSKEELGERFVSATPPADVVGLDTPTGHYGVKWEIEDGFEWDETGVTFTVTITGQPAVDYNGAVAVIKAGQAGDHDHGAQPHFDLMIPGPFCAEPPEPTYTISGMKFNDENENGVNDEEPGLEDWTINIEGPDQFNDSTATDEEGNYNFSELSPGSYTVCEIQQENWGQTYPLNNNGCHVVEIEDEDANGIDFGNYQLPPEPEPYCGDSNLDQGEQCDDGENNGLQCTPEYGSSCTYCSVECTIIELEGSYCGDGILDEAYEECDGEAGVGKNQACTQECTLINLEHCGDGIKNGDEECDGTDGVPEHYICTQQCTLEYIPYCGDGILDDGEQCDDGNNIDGDGCSASCQIEIQLGDIVINEIMQNPDIVSDSNGEWFEVYNSTGSDIDLEGCVIRDNGIDSHAIGSSLVVPPGGYAVLARNGDSAQNGGITPDYVYSSFILTNTADEIILECNETEIDRVEYDGGPNFPNPTGASMILANPALDNNVGANWCESTSPFGDGDLGTPGAVNDSCGEGPGPEEPVCGNDVLEEGEQCDDGNNINGDGCSAECTIEEVPSEPECETGETQSCDTGQLGICASGTQTCNQDGFWEECVQDEEPVSEVCDDALDNDCDGDVDTNDSDCQAPPASIPQASASFGGGASYSGTLLLIYNEQNGNVIDSSAIVTWYTNILGTSRVVYDTTSHPVLISPPNYGYAHSTPEDPNKVTYHIGIMTGLTPGTTYYWRAISHSSPEVLGDEMTFTTGFVETECTAGKTQSCDTGIPGTCAAGTQVCNEEGSWATCVVDDAPIAEICDNQLDDNCDGYVDEVDCSTGGVMCIYYYNDSDGDGYGTLTDSQCLTEPSGNYTATQGGDCDGTNPEINPEAVEICDNQIDDNCNEDIDCDDEECVEDEICIAEEEIIAEEESKTGLGVLLAAIGNIFDLAGNLRWLLTLALLLLAILLILLLFSRKKKTKKSEFV